MAFDAGSIEATLTLNRNPFTAGLAAAKAQVDQWKRRVSPVEVDVKVNLNQRDLIQLEALLKRVGRQRVAANARVLVDRLQFDKLLRDLRQFDRKKYTARLDVDAKKATADVIAFRTLLSSLNDQTVKLSANTRAFGGAARDGFGESGTHFQKMAGLIIGLLPVISSAFTAAVGGAGALVSAFFLAGVGAGAFALVAVPAFKQVKAAVAAGQAEINKLPPGLREAGNAMKGLLDEYDKLVKANQRITGIALSSWFNAGTAALKTLNPLIDASAKGFSTAGAMMETYFNSPSWGRFVQWASQAMLPAITQLFRGIIALIRIVNNLVRAFWELGGSQIMEMIVSGLEQFAEYTERIGENRSFQAFMEAAVRSFPVVAKFLGVLVEFIFKLAIGLEPLGTLILRILTGVFEALNSMPIPMIQALALAIAGVWAAMALGAGGPVALAIGALAVIATMFANAYEKSQQFRDGINSLIQPLKDWFIPLAQQLADIWEQKVIPAWDKAVAATRENLLPVLEELWRKFQEQVLPALNSAAITFTDVLLPAILEFWAAIQPFVAYVVKAFGEEIIFALEATVRVFDGAFQMIAGLLKIFTGIFTADWKTFGDGLSLTAEGFWTAVAGVFGMSLEDLKHKMQDWDAEIDGMWRSFWDGLTGWFRGLWEGIRLWWNGFLDILSGDTSQGADKIGQAWRKIANLFRDPINWVINTVINDGIIGAWNQVMGWIGVGGISGRVPSLPAFAAGGPVTGGVPGKDSVPILAQQGEYVLSRPAVQSMGGIGAVDALHTAARGGVPGGARQTKGVPGYAEGGPVGTVSMWSLLSGQVTNLFKSLSFGASGMGGAIGDAIGRIPGALIDKVIEAAKKKLEAIVMTIFGGGGGGVGSVVANGALQQMIAATAAQFGWGSPAAIAAINWIISHESGGRPTAQNPTSTAYGLFQFLNSTWSSVGGVKTSDPAAQILYGLRYIASRYGSPQGAVSFWQSHGWYDQGGLLPPGTTLATNMTGKPEVILPMDALRPSQGLTVEEIIALIREFGGGGGSGGDVYNVMLPDRATVRELANSLDFKRRVVSKGRYSR